MENRSSVLVVACVLLLGTATALFGRGQGDGEGASGDVPIVEVWWAAANNQPAESADAPNVYQQRVIDELGIGYERPNVPWNSGIDYGERLKLRLAAADAPNIIRLPRNGFSLPELIESGVAADITDLLSVHAPIIDASVSDDLWSLIKYDSPGRDRIHAIPSLRNATTHGAFIRQDWLDRVGLEMPVTAEDYRNVLRAFRDQDANGNGDPNDEVPTTGRTPGRWWDNLFTPFGVAMVEGFPTWDYYDGEVQYSGVQPEMRRAIQFVAELYQEGLIDPEVLINTGRTWSGKIVNDLVGQFFHMPIFLPTRLRDTYTAFEEAEWTWMPPYQVDGVTGKWSEGYVSSTNTLENVIITGDEDEVINALTLLEYLQTPEVIQANIEGFEGLHYEIVDGEKVRLPLTEENQIQTWTQSALINTNATYQAQFEINVQAWDEGVQERAKASYYSVMEDAIVFSVIGTSLPSTVYDGYPDIESHLLYFTMLAKVMVGDEPIEAFDEFVEEWFATGGDEVTARVQQAAADLGL